MEQYLMDTNVISDYFSASFPAPGMALMDASSSLQLKNLGYIQAFSPKTSGGVH